MMCEMREHNGNNQGKIKYLPRSQQARKSWVEKSWEVESSKDSKSWKTDRKFEEILKRKKLLIKKTVSIYTNIMDSVWMVKIE